MEAYVGLGSNIEPRIRFLIRAVHGLANQESIQVNAVSPVFSSEALTLGEEEQPDFLNAVIRVQTTLNPVSLLDACLRIERDLGRERALEAWAPRTIDLDLLLYENEVINSKSLTVPHPRMSDRLFVLLPLSEVWPCDRKLPGFTSTLRELIDDCEDASRPLKTIITLEKYE